MLNFLECTWNFQCSEEKNEPHRLSVSEVIDSEICAYLNVSQGFFLKTLCQSQKLFKSEKKKLLSNFFFLLSKSELEKVIFNHI